MDRPRHVPGVGVRSRVTLGGHPVHPMLIPFPIALLTAALVTDIVFAWADNPFWAEMSFWLILGGFVTGALAALFGLIDFFGLEAARKHTAGWIHFLGNAGVLVLSLGNLLLRWGAPAPAIEPWGLLLSAVVAAILAVTGWYGGELSYRHKIGVIPEGNTE